jgi:hypothetical protein
MQLQKGLSVDKTVPILPLFVILRSPAQPVRPPPENPENKK